MAIVRRCLVMLLLGAVGCDAGLGAQGAPCSTSEECQAGLLCDFGRMPHTCEGMGSLMSDLSARVDAGIPDLPSTMADP